MGEGHQLARADAPEDHHARATDDQIEVAVAAMKKVI